MRGRRRPIAATAVTALVAATLAACSATAASQPDADAGSDAADVGHVHNLALADGDLYLGSHNGLWKHPADGDIVRVSQDAWDVMGLTKSAKGWLAGGHPGPGQSGPPSLGLQQSGDGGRTWQPLSLMGAVDFHRLTTAGEVVAGLSSSDGALLISADGGRSWRTTPGAALFDVVIDPSDVAVFIGTTQEGPSRSTDGGATFEPLQDAPLIALVAWSGETVYGAAPDGVIYASVNKGAAWQERGRVGAAPTALAADNDSVVVLADGVVLESSDGGRTFQPRLSGLSRE